MDKEEIIKLVRPKPYEKVGLIFDVVGWIPKSWLLHGEYGLGVSLMDVNGKEFMGTGGEVIPGLFRRFRKNVKFYSNIDLSHLRPPEHPQGLIIEISGHQEKSFLLLPLIIKGSKENEREEKELEGQLSNTIVKIIKLKEDWNNYRNELQRINARAVNKKEILEGVFEIFQKSEEHFESFSESDEDLEQKALEEKYKEAIQWHGPLLGRIVGRMNGFEFWVYSGDYTPKHFHVIHKSQGVNARFSFPKLELISYKGRSATIGKKEENKIREFFGIPKNFQELEHEFQKQVL
ncbi:MAG: hypothetical protein AAB407_02200 [Patescibacteria group bacterium]